MPNLTPSALQSFNNDLVRALESLKEKRDALTLDIQNDSEAKHGLQHQIHELTKKLERVDESLSRNVARKAEYDRLIVETEAAYLKVRAFKFFFYKCLLVKVSWMN